MQSSLINETYTPRYPLNQFVERFFYYEGINVAHQIDRFLPDGNSEMIIELTGLPQYIYDNDTLREKQLCRNGWVSGVRTEPISIPSGNRSRMLVVYFKKGMAYPFYDMPMNELSDLVVDGDLMFGRRFTEMRERLLEIKTITEVFHHVESYLIQLARDRMQIETAGACVQYAVKALIRQPQLIQLQKLAGQIGYTQKHFIQLFKKQVGVTPKEYLKVMRFQKAIGDIEKKTDPSWSAIAVDCGFYDQAHFIHDFKKFSGFTPESYLKRKNGILNYVPVA